MLRAGVNVLAVAAENGGTTPNPAGLIGALIIKFRDGHALTVPTDKDWQLGPSHQRQVDHGRDCREGIGVRRWNWARWAWPRGESCRSRAAEPDVFCDFSVVTDLLGKLGVPPDFESDGPMRYTHRRDGEADIYFVANREDRQVEASCTFRVSGKAPELWDPLTGQTRALPEFTSRDGRTTVPMRFEAAQSFFVVFRKPVARKARAPRRTFPSGAANWRRVGRALGKSPF